ncbi:DMT family transporter [Pelagibaculum spongiae]|uniref:EamA family transporter n=1 Tax=Pelagibaculum spongiae TaxID=2080658 RepID=A0A2V1GWX7_9GAMM|nr:DMT family transporter [Pelagibaculum spongiae]PVZ65427.1 EamA family transporter [Pelagibaculum spongiae]
MISIGVRYMVLSALGFALMTACVKVVGNYGIPVLEIVAARAIVSLVISYVDVRRKKLSIWGNNKPLLIARGCAGALALMCVYFAVTSLPLAEATILQYLYPVFTAILALVFLKERVRPTTIICILLCITGLLVMVRPDFILGGVISEATASLPLISVMAALLGAFGSAVAYVIVKKLSRSEDSSVIIFYFPLIALPISMLLLLLADNFVLPNLEVLGLMVLIGIFTQIGQVGLTKAMQTEAASSATAYSYVQVIFSMLLGWALFSELPTYWTWIGGGLIISGALINLYGSRPQRQIKKVA